MTRKGESFETRIRDFGIGISEDVRERIFDEGFTAGEEEGLGLGLFIAKKLVESYSGTISVEPNQPSGAIFIVTLPAAVDA